MKAFARLLGLVFICLPVGFGSLGCSNQGEGERCDTRNNGSGDCQDGLVCNTSVLANAATQGICCPKDTPSSVPACIQGLTQVPTSDAGVTVDAATTSDAGAAIDAGADATPAIDATSEASLPEVDGGEAEDAAAE